MVLPSLRPSLVVPLDPFQWWDFGSVLFVLEYQSFRGLESGRSCRRTCSWRSRRERMSGGGGGGGSEGRIREGETVKCVVFGNVFCISCILHCLV